ncbi:MAG: EamA family transporter [Pirellulales bacterium]
MATCRSSGRLGQLGLAVVVPVTTAVIVASGAVFGLWWLGERVTLRGIAAMVLLVVAVTILSSTARRANVAVHGSGDAESSAWMLAMLGVVAACTAGVAYSATTATLRRALVRGIALPVGLAVISTTGVVGLSAFALLTDGPGMVADITLGQWRDMAAAGVFNALAFASLGVSLHRITVTQSNILGASQTAMAAIAGVAFFGEPVSAALVAGVALTAVSMVIIERRGAAPVSASTAASESTGEPGDG